MGRVQQASMGYRVMQLTVGILCMVAIANLQYGWTLFVNPINQGHGWTLAQIQIAFSVFILMETWLVPVEGWLIDKFGLRTMFLIGGVLVGVSWVVNAFAGSLGMLYFAAVLGGIGGGIVYGGSVGNALKWFPDHRGLAAGLTAAGYGAGSAATVIPIANMIKERGYESAFFAFGIVQGAIVLVLALLIRAPETGETPPLAKTTVQQSGKDLRPQEVVRAPAFWLMYVMFVLVGAGGLMAVAQLGPMAKDFGISDSPVTFALWTLPALQWALSIDRVLNGFCRPFFGWVSDRIGRENTMFIAFLIEGIAIFVWWQLARNPILFVLLTGLVFFAWGEIYSLFPATSADLFGRKYATVNYGLLYTAKGTASLLVPLGNLITAATGSWTYVLVIAAIANIVAAGLALFVLKPMRLRLLAKGA
jgi:OFA family oxalate/formate antiporter-like MFS transporter